MAVIVEIADAPGDYVFYCAGCGYHHNINTKRKNSNGSKWEFNGNLKLPSFYPSLEILIPHGKTYERCHFTITEGRILYSQDCTHRYAGCRLMLPDLTAYDIASFRKSLKRRNFCIKK